MSTMASLALIATILVILSAIGLYYGFSNKIKELEARLKKLETANAKRLNYHAFESLLDAMAALDKEKTEMEFHVSLIDNAQAHLRKAMKVGTKDDQ